MPMEIITAVLVLILASVTLAATYVGLLGVVGALRIQRCERCGHQSIQRQSADIAGCGFCRHERLFHPVRTTRRPHLGH